MNDNVPPTSAPRRSHPFLWPLLIVAWICIVAGAVHTFRSQRPAGLPSLAVLPLTPPGAWETVLEPEAPRPLVLCLGRDHQVHAVRIGGAAEPRDAAEADRIMARLKELVPPLTAVYVQIEPRAADDAREPPVATILVPPPGTPHDEPFPYDKSQMLGAVLIQEGLARADTESLYRYRTEFESLEADARRHHRGIWALTAEAAAIATPSAGNM